MSHPDVLRTALVDAAALALVVGLSAVFYIGGLGLHSDDWFFLDYMGSLPDRSFTGLFSGLMENYVLSPRPVQILVMESLYLGFGLDPRWGHLMNHGALAAGGVLLYLAVRRASGSRLLGFLLAAVVLSLPHATTVRMWFANYQATASFLFFALATLATVRAAVATGRGIGWQVTAAAAAAARALAYELFMPLLAGLPLAVFLATRLDGACPVPPRTVAARMAVATAVALAVLSAASVYKLSVTPIGGSWTPGRWLDMTAALYLSATRMAFLDLGVFLPVNVLRTGTGDGLRIGAVLAGAGAVIVILLTAARMSADDGRPGLGLGTPGAALLALAVGLAGFAAGYVVILQNFYATITPTGIGNRINVAAAVGVAVAVVAAAGLVDLALGQRWRRNVTLPLVALFCGLGVFLDTTVGIHWAEAASLQDGVYRRLRAALPGIGGTDRVLLAGICPYHGPAPVFTSSWDLSARLRMDTGSRDVRADVIDADGVVREDGVETREYGEPRLYAYGDLYVYDDSTGTSARLTDAAAARAHFAARPIAGSVPCAFRDGVGVPWF
jgi:hypothetical protein